MPFQLKLLLKTPPFLLKGGQQKMLFLLSQLAAVKMKADPVIFLTVQYLQPVEAGGMMIRLPG